MVAGEQQILQLKMLHIGRPRLHPPDVAMTDIFQSEEYGRYQYRKRRMAGLKSKNQRLVEQIQEKEQGVIKERFEAAEMLRNSVEGANVGHACFLDLT